MSNFMEVRDYDERELAECRRGNRLVAEGHSVYAAIREVQKTMPWRTLESIRTKMRRIKDRG